MIRLSRAAAGKAWRPGLTLLVAASFVLASCRPAPPQTARAAAPADRHAPFNFTARRAIVVAAHPLAVEAGVSLLKAGGNAVDAAVATAFALNAAEPFASGIGGGGFMVIYIAAEKRTTVINYREKAPAASTPGMFREKGEEANRWRTSTGLGVAVPGAPAGWELALKKYGTRTLAEAARPAIEIAERGFDVSATFSGINNDEFEKLARNAGESTCYLNQGLPYEPGERFRNPELAATFRTLVEKGAAEFYTGAIARKIVDAVRARDGVMTLEDLAAYRAVEAAPLEGTYKKYFIATAPPPASGGLHLVELLNIAENWPLRKWGPNSPAAIHHLSEALRFVFADRGRYLGDPDFIPVPVEEMLSKQYAASIAARIPPDRPAGGYPYGSFGPKPGDAANTTHLCVVDPAGNVVSLTQSINDFFGTGIVPEGTGFLLNDHMDDFASDPESPNAPGPGRRPVSSMGPLIMFRGGRPFLALGSPGGTRIFSSLAQIILNLTEFGMSLDAAIEAPRFFSYSTGGAPRPVEVESRVPEATLDELRKWRQEVRVREPYDKYFGGAQGIMILRDRSVLYGGADSRRDGWGAGY
ncbi:MAG: gamma-glutamyltransferase [Candidatus Aminicenantes bacterium RBG_16_63_16]|nr:MAG: gamma-glutamyltransferase [Candidatus Aminicenantes bacterium RBG_16_63_16]